MKNHEAYNDKTFENDIALIRLDRKVEFSKSVYPICLPPKGKKFTDTRAFVIGKLYIIRIVTNYSTNNSQIDTHTHI